MTTIPDDVIEAMAEAISAGVMYDEPSAQVTRAALAAAEAVGFKLVPREPTDAMVEAAAETPRMLQINSMISFCATRGITLPPCEGAADSPLAEAFTAMYDAAPSVKP
jgi:hypothetical protein